MMSTEAGTAEVLKLPYPPAILYSTSEQCQLFCAEGTHKSTPPNAMTGAWLCETQQAWACPFSALAFAQRTIARGPT